MDYIKTRLLDSLFLLAIAALLYYDWPRIVQGWRDAGLLK